MDRSLKKLFAIIVSCCFMLLAYTTDTYAYSIYPSCISSEYVSVFRDIAQGLSPSDNYVFWRSGEFEYTMLVGDLELLNNTVSSSDVLTEYKIVVSDNGNYDYTVSDEIYGLTLDVSNHLIYSDVGNYPVLIDRSTSFNYLIVLILSVGSICALIRPNFNFVMRFRNGN